MVFTTGCHYDDIEHNSNLFKINTNLLDADRIVNVKYNAIYVFCYRQFLLM